jgi:hypothetical protein
VLRGPTWIDQLYDTTANTTGGSAVAAVALNQDQLLAEAIPALTWPVGTHPARIFGNTRNIDLPSLVDQSNWPRNFINGVREWRHSDMREVAYIYQYAVFDEIITISKTP